MKWKKAYTELVEQEIDIVDKAAQALNRAFHRYANLIDKAEEYNDEEEDGLEALTARFARLSDLMTHKIFRLIDEIELESDGSVRDRIQRAEKRKLIASAERFVDIRRLRNDIAHKYLTNEMKELYRLVVEYIPDVLDSVRRVKEYCSQKMSSEAHKTAPKKK